MVAYYQLFRPLGVPFRFQSGVLPWILPAVGTCQVQNTRDGVTWTVLRDRFTKRYSRSSYRKISSEVVSEVAHKPYESRDKCL